MLSYDWLRQTMWVSEMPGKPRHSGAAIFAAVLLLHAAAAGFAPQNAPPAGAEPPAGQPGAAISPQQLDDLVAPIALYPDPVVGEVLAASYPIEIAEAEQWLRDSEMETRQAHGRGEKTEL
jgi:hypothetical protein